MTDFASLRLRYETELFEHVIPFWERHSPDPQHGGFYNCLDRDGSLFDTTKHMWLQGRQVWMFSTLYRTVEQRPKWLAMAKSGLDFMLRHAVREDGRVYFALAADGRPVAQQRKIFSECFFVMAMAGYARATGDAALLADARDRLAWIWERAFDWTTVGRPSFDGQTPTSMLAVPMILLNLIEEVAGDDWRDYRTEVDDCVRKIRLHVHEDLHVVFENVAPDGSLIDSPDGRLLNPGHAIEAGWFLQHWAQRLDDPEMGRLATDMVRWSFDRGWDHQYEGIFYFLDQSGFSPVPLEWPMKLWWPHCEALYAHILNYSITGEDRDLDAFRLVDDYAFRHFSDPAHGEWFGYLDREGRVTHRFKGGPYKGCFHVPRALLLSRNVLMTLEQRTASESAPSSSV
jgi:N-acylglucosamine 2-epimerase